MTLYLTQDDVKKVLDMPSTIQAVEDGFREMGKKAIEMPPRVYLHFPKGVLIAMPAYMPGLGAAGTKLVTVHPENKKEYNLPAVIARIILNKIRVIQRRAYGLRDEEYLRLKVLTCTLPEI